MQLPALLQAARTALLSAIPDAWAFYVYGSVARDEATADSDIDLAVLLPPGHTLPDRLQLSATLAHLLGQEVDIVDLREVGDFLRMEVLRDGQAFYVADPDRLLEWEAQAIAAFCEHRYRIRGILEDFSRTGVGYAP
jgi:predicted nucleotidyltransferase